MKPLHEMSLDEVLAESRRRDVRRARGLPLTETPAEVAARVGEDDSRLEKEIQRDVVKLYRRFDCIVYNLSQARKSKQTPGLGDLWVFTPPILTDASRNRIGFWHETKTTTGKLRPDQKEFREYCLETAGITRHVVGGVAAAEEFLVYVEVCERNPDSSLSRRWR